MPDSLKNLLTSVDWSRMASRPDVRNALVGSALGGALLGGASLAGDHDPEEGKMTPVGDALTGALLGGVAGYGIPKGLELFRHSGTLAPADDQLPDSNYLGAAAKGGLLGAGAIGASIPVTYGAHALKLINKAHDPRYVAARSSAFGERAASLLRRVMQDRAAGRTADLKHNMARAANAQAASVAYDAGLFPGKDSEYAKVVAQLNKQLGKAKGRDKAAIERTLAAMAKTRRQRLFGFTSLGDLTKDVTGAAQTALAGGKTKAPPRLFRDLLLGKGKGVFSGRGKEYLQTVFSGKRYAKGPGLLASRPALRMLGRAGKWGVGGAAFATALHALLGPSAKDNFKN